MSRVYSFSGLVSSSFEDSCDFNFNGFQATVTFYNDSLYQTPVVPTGGFVRVEALKNGASGWTEFNGSPLTATKADSSAVFSGPISRLRVTPIGITGATHLTVSVTASQETLSTSSATLDSEGKLLAAAYVSDASDREGVVSVTGEQHVGYKTDDININFQYGISTFDIKDGGTTTGTGSVSAQDSMAVISTGTGIGEAVIQSKDTIRYRAGHEVHGAVSFVFATPEANTNQYAGFLNNDDGWCVGYQGTEFGLWFIEGGNANFIPQSTWNKDKMDGTGASGYNINPQMANLYRLTYAWHGFLPLQLEIYVGNNKWRRAHVEEFTNIATEPHLQNPSLPLGAKIERTSGTGANLSMFTGSWRGGAIAGIPEDNSSNRWFAHTELDFPIINGRNNVFTIYNKPTYAGKTNHVVVELGIVTFDSTANKTVAVYGVKNGTLTGNSAFVDKDTTNSVISVSTGGTVSGGAQGPATVIKSGGDRRTDVRGTGIKIFPNEYFTFEVDPGGSVNGNFSISARFVEYH